MTTTNYPTNYVMIDYENVQPRSLDILASFPFKLYVFVGASQAKVPFELADAMQKFGEDAKYIKIAASGKNALDFHIAFYIGELAVKDPKAYFHIISRDTGFDPLISHLKSRNIRVMREKNLAEIPVLRVSNGTSYDEKIEAIVKNLAGRGQSRPRKVQTLANTINSIFTRQLDEEELLSLIEELKRRNYITINDTKVSYTLPR